MHRTQAETRRFIILLLTGVWKQRVRVLVELGANVHAQDAKGRTPLFWAEINRNEEAVIFLKKHAINKRRSKSTTASVVDSALQAAAEVAAAAMAALLIVEEIDEKQAASFKQGNSNKARTRRNRRKVNPDKLVTGSKGLNETVFCGSVAS
jgi:ankyrin repeat protein